MPTVVERATPPQDPDKPKSTIDLAGRYRVVHGQFVVALEAEQLKDALAKGLPPHEYLYPGSIVDLTHDEAALALPHGVIEPESVALKGAAKRVMKKAS